MRKLAKLTMISFVLFAWEGFLIYRMAKDYPGNLFYASLFILLSQAYTVLLSLTVYRSEMRGQGELSPSVTIGTVLSTITVGMVWLALHAF